MQIAVSCFAILQQMPRTSMRPGDANSLAEPLLFTAARTIDKNMHTFSFRTDSLTVDAYS